MKKRNSVKFEIKSNTLKQNIILCMLPVLCCVVFRLMKLTGEADMKVLMRLAFAGVAAYGAYAAYKKQLTAEKIVFLVIIAGCVLRIGYTLYTHAFTRGHDIGMNNAEAVGHWGYFYHIVNGNLPPSNEYQFYQPPLYYMVGAVFIRIMMAIKGMNEWGGLEYIPQLVSCTSSIVVMITTVKIMDELNISKKFQLIPIVLIAVHPSQIMAAGRMNNDAMVQMFMVLSLYATLRWHKSQKISDIIYTAVFIGCGMMTKISCGVIAFVTGPVMIYNFVNAIVKKDNQKIKNLIIQFAVFAVICFPLGLWYGIRNYIKFDQPLNFVHELPKNTAIYTGEEAWIDRWVKFPLFHFKDAPYVNMADDTNIWMILIKSGVHGEFTWDNISSFLAWTLDYVYLALMLMTLWAIGFTMIRNKKIDNAAKYSAFWVWVLIAVSYIQFNIAYPYSCTPNFRYVLPAQIAGAFFVAYMCQYCYANKEKKLCRYGGIAYTAVIALFCAMSIMHFC